MAIATPIGWSLMVFSTQLGTGDQPPPPLRTKALREKTFSAFQRSYGYDPMPPFHGGSAEQKIFEQKSAVDMADVASHHI